MEQYKIIQPNSLPTIIEGEYFKRIHQKHVEVYGENGANNIVQNVRATYQKLMQQLSENEKNHNSLLVGKVQSGKTSNLELLTALAFDNGYNFLLILGGYDKELLKQSTERFGGTFESEGGDAVVFSEKPVLFTTNEITKESVSINSLDPEFVKQLIEEKRPIIITCLKRPPAMKVALRAIIKIQESVSGIVPFIIDDEGDQASLNTAKDKSRDSTPTYKHIVRLKKELHNPLYLSVTATPQANIFQEDISALNPASIHTVQPGNGYNGASIYHLSDNQIIESIHEIDQPVLMSDSLKEAIYYFFVASAIKRIRVTQKKDMRSDMIIHVDRTVAAHGSIYSSIYDMLEEIKQAFINSDSIDFYVNRLKNSYDKYLKDEIKKQFPFDDALITTVAKTIQSTGAILQNGIGKQTKQMELTKFHKIYIGGDLLQRGLTFPNLLVSYFTRFSKSGGNMDTTLQRARWFGYRSKYLDLCKIFTTDEIAKEFSALAEVEDDLWEQFDDVERGVLSVKDIIIQAENTKQKPTAKNKAKFKKITFKNRWIKQKFIVVDDDEISNNNSIIQSLIASIPAWTPTTAGSTNGAQTAKYALFSSEQLKMLIQSINTAFDREPFNKRPLIDLMDQSDIPVILMWTNAEDMIRYRSIYNDAAQDRIKVLHQGANTTDLEKLTYLGDQKVIVSPDKINIQIHYISPGISKTNRLGKEQYMFAIYIPKDKVYFIKDND